MESLAGCATPGAAWAAWDWGTGGWGIHIRQFNYLLSLYLFDRRRTHLFDGFSRQVGQTRPRYRTYENREKTNKTMVLLVRRE